MTDALPDFDVYVDKGQIEIIPYAEWYTINNVFDGERVLNGWVEKLRKAQERGFSGLRLTGNESWLEPGVWKDFIDYEQSINEVIGQYEMLAVCSYPLDKCDANDIMDVVSTHQFALTRRNGDWKIIEDHEQKKVRKALRENEAMLWAVLDQMPSGVTIRDACTGTLILSNAKSNELWEGHVEDPSEYEQYRGLHPDGRPYRTEEWPLFRSMATGEVVKGEEIQRDRSDGTRTTLSINSTPIRDSQGNIIVGVAITQDITERKRAAEALGEIEARRKVAEAVEVERKRLFDVLETLPTMICLLTPDYHVAFANRSFREKFGESNGRHCYEYCFGRPEPCEFCESYTVLKTGQPHHWEVTDPDGNVIAAHDFPFTDVDGSPLILEMDIDITAQKKAEATLQDLNETLEKRVAERTAELMEKQEELNEAKNQAELYLDLMGHDINNMHQVALGYLELARDMMSVDERQREFLDRPLEVLQRSSRLIDNVRKLQKIKDGVFQTDLVDVCKVLKDVEREYGAVSNKTIALNINGNEHCHILANDLLHDVFSNLVSNAIKHSNGTNANIIMDIDRVHESGGPYYRIMIEDNGPGVTDDMKDKIFNRLQRGETKARGMGLGLYLVKTLVDSYQGRVWVEDRILNDHTKGARFVVMLPAIDH